MLVFSRKPDQSIVIGDGIEVMVLGVGREGVRLGIRAPRHVQVHRREVFEAIAAENEAARTSRAAVAQALHQARLTQPR
jgi:carbon storage regulator